MAAENSALPVNYLEFLFYLIFLWKTFLKNLTDSKLLIGGVYKGY